MLLADLVLVGVAVLNQRLPLVIVRSRVVDVPIPIDRRHAIGQTRPGLGAIDLRLGLGIGQGRRQPPGGVRFVPGQPILGCLQGLTPRHPGTRGLIH